MKSLNKALRNLFLKIKKIFQHIQYRGYLTWPLSKKLSRPIFIIGSGSSGTTILAKILSKHKDIYFAGEADVAWYIADERTSLREVRVKGKFRFNESDYAERKAVTLNRIFCRAVLHAGKKRLLEKTPHNLYRTKWIKKMFPDATFIAIIRGGKEFIVSVKKRNMHEISLKAYPGWWWRRDDYIWHAYKAMFLESHPEYSGIVKDTLDDENRAAVQWINAMESKNIESLSKENCLTLKYEDLIENPEDVLRRIYEFAELEYDENPVKFAKKHLKSPVYSGEPKLIPEIKKIFNKYCKMHGYDILE